MDKELIIALDFANGREVADFLKPFGNQQLFLKVGMELFYQEGPLDCQFVKRSESSYLFRFKAS